MIKHHILGFQKGQNCAFWPLHFEDIRLSSQTLDLNTQQGLIKHPNTILNEFNHSEVFNHILLHHPMDVVFKGPLWQKQLSKDNTNIFNQKTNSVWSKLHTNRHEKLVLSYYVNIDLHIFQIQSLHCIKLGHNFLTLSTT